MKSKTAAFAEIRLGILTAKLHIARIPSKPHPSVEKIAGWLALVDKTMPKTELALMAYVRYVEKEKTKIKHGFSLPKGFH
jgi:hypothetical protein